MVTKVKLICVLTLLPLFLLATTVPVTRAYMEPDDWLEPSIWMQDTDDTPITPGGPWYDDNSGPGQPQRELLYVGINWDETYVYVRWDFEATPAEITSVYYALKIDTEDLTVPEDPLDDTRGTHALGIEVNNKGMISVTIRVPNHPKFDKIWTGQDTDWTVTQIPLNEDDPFTVRTAVEARFPWSELSTNGDPVDFLAITAQSHANRGDQGWTSAIKDYIEIGATHTPWFTNPSMIILITTGLVAFIKKKKVGEYRTR